MEHCRSGTCFCALVWGRKRPHHGVARSDTENRGGFASGHMDGSFEENGDVGSPNTETPPIESAAGMPSR